MQKKLSYITLLLSLFIIVFLTLLFFRHSLITLFLERPDQNNISALLFFEYSSLFFVSSSALLFLFILYTLFMHFVIREKVAHLRTIVFSQGNVSKSHLDILYEMSPVPYFLMNENGEMRMPNKATLRFFEEDEEECKNRNFFESLYRNPTEELTQKNTPDFLKAKVERDIPIKNEEVTLLTQKKEVRFVKVSIFSLPKSTAIVHRHIVSLIDITHEKEIEHTKTDFLLLASHQLRTPTTTIKWYVDYLRSMKTEEVSEKARAYLDEIYEGNERMSEIIRTLLTVSKIEMGVLDPEYRQVRINSIVEDILEELKSLVQKKEIVFTIEKKGDDMVTTDKMMLRIVIHNLLTNVLKYTPQKGGARISLLREGALFYINVSDSGRGIPLSEQEHIFTKMYRATNAKKMSAQGTGLGLYLSKAFIEKLGGTLSFVSLEGKGSTFTITLPLVANDA
jgi:PAS domain S-box-containing protein